MIVRSFMLCKSHERSDEGLIIKYPFSLIAFDNFPSEEFPYSIAVSLDFHDGNIHGLWMELLDPEGKICARWKKYKYKGSEVGASRGVIFTHKMIFKTAGTYRYFVYLDDEKIGEYSLVVQDQSN